MGRKIKVMQIIPDLGLGGAEIMVENLATSLVEEGVDVAVVSLYKYHSAITERLESNNIPVYYLGKKNGPDLKIIFRLFSLVKKEKPDAIHTHLYAMTYAIPAAILAGGLTKVHTIHNIAKKEAGNFKRKINKIFYKHCKVIPVSISPLVKESVVKEYGISENQVPMVYNGIDLKKCMPKKDYCSKRKVTNILHIGRFSEQKNHIGLIESFKLLHDKAPNTVLKLIGTGELEKNVKDIVAELNLNDCVEFLGLQSNVYSHLNNADIFVLPSLWEGMPMTLIEAMGTGLPIVATGVGGVPDMIENNVTGLLVDIDKEQIAEALLKLINDGNLRQKLGNNARISSERFSVKEMARGYAKLYR